jgi:hypothetical protein
MQPENAVRVYKAFESSGRAFKAQSATSSSRSNTDCFLPNANGVFDVFDNAPQTKDFSRYERTLRKASRRDTGLSRMPMAVPKRRSKVKTKQAAGIRVTCLKIMYPSQPLSLIHWPLMPFVSVLSYAPTAQSCICPQRCESYSSYSGQFTHTINSIRS